MILTMILHVPAVQNNIAQSTKDALTETLGTRIDIDRIDLGFLNRIIIDGLVIYDKSDQKMLSTTRVSARISIWDLLQGLAFSETRIHISSAQVFGLNANIYRNDSITPLNCQFLLDSLSSKDSTQSTPLDLHIASLVLRNGSLTYNDWSKPHKHNVFDASHISIDHISSHIIIYQLTDEIINAQLKSLSFNESSGLAIKKFTFDIDAKTTTKNGPAHINLSDFELNLPDSRISIPTFSLSYLIKDNNIAEGTMNVNGKMILNGLSPKDIQPILPTDISSLPKLSLSASLKGTDRSSTGHIALSTLDKTLNLNTNFTLANILTDFSWQIPNLTISANSHFFPSIISVLNLPQQLSSIGSLELSSTLNGTTSSIAGTTKITTGALGNINIKGDYNGKSGTFDIDAQKIDLQKITLNNDLGNLTGKISSSFTITNGKPTQANAECKFSNLTIKGYEYTNLLLNATLQNNGTTDVVEFAINSNDNNINADIDGTLHLNAWKPYKAVCSIDVNNIAPATIGLTDTWGHSTFSFTADANLQGNSLNDLNALIDISDLTIHGAHKSLAETDAYHQSHTLHSFRISTENNGERQRTTSITSDFLNADLQGIYTIESLPTTFSNIISRNLPSMPGFSQTRNTYDNLNFNITVNSLDFLRIMTGADISLLGTARIKGYANDINGVSNIYAAVPSLRLNDYRISDLNILSWTPDSTLHATLSTNIETVNGESYAINLNANAINDHLSTTLSWHDSNNHFRGSINTSATADYTYSDKKGLRFLLNPSEVHLGDSIWHINSRDIIYADNEIIVNNFSIGNENQHVHINGTASTLPSDSITAELKNINVEYIMNLVNFHSVEFAGFASGKATGRQLLSSTPLATAHLDVGDFRFENGRLGTLSVDANYNNEMEQIDIDGVTSDSVSSLGIKGFVSPQRNGLHLDLAARNTRLEFMESFCSSFLDEVDVYANGDVVLEGPFSALTLTGNVFAKGNIHVSTLGCSYSLPGDSIYFTLNDIKMKDGVLLDRYNQRAIINGGLHHTHLSNLSYDFDIEARNFLAYDFHDFREEVFYGTAFMTGHCNIEGRPSLLNVNVNGRTEEGSIIVYDASSPDGIYGQDYITWGSINKRKTEQHYSTPATTGEDDSDDIRTNIHLNFIFDIDPKCTLRVLMDRNTGDYIDLNGIGSFHATYFNKGAFNLFGKYYVQKGHYLMSIQNFITRDFEFQSGDINFNGDPFTASLNLKAKYTLTSVPLSQLNIGESFNKNNVPVDCILYITGTAGAPLVDFDMDLPTVNTDIKQMIYSLIDTEDERRQQVIYLLSVGQFLSQGVNNSATNENEQYNRTNQAMNSIISGTISQQLAAALGTALNSSKWTVGANISPGNEGFTNAEYEGKFTGTLLNNRLLINGVVGYRDNAATSTQGFIGDFDVRYLLKPNGNIAVKVYNQANDRYFIRNSLNTQGVGLIFKTDFNNTLDLFRKKKKQ